MNIIYNAFGTLMKVIYEFVSFGNYGLAIIIFTILTKLLLMPLTYKQQKSARQTQVMQKELAEIQQLFKGDKERIAEETQKLYTKYGVNPMAGCLPLLIQFPIIMALYAVVREPITYILGKTESLITGAAKALQIADGSINIELDILNKLSADPSLVEKVEGFTKADIINFNFLGINLGETPTIDFGKIGENPGLFLPLLLIPIMAAATTFLQSKLMTKMNAGRQGEANAQAQAMNKSMSLMMPIMILFLAFTVPASLGLYWITGNVFQIVQQIIINAILNKKNPQEPGKIIETKGRNVS